MHRVTHTPSRTIATVYFKPKGIPPYDASETREVQFVVEQEFTSLTRTQLFELAKEYVIENDLIDKSAVKNHWEPYKTDIDIPSTPDETAELIGY